MGGTGWTINSDTPSREGSADVYIYIYILDVDALVASQSTYGFFCLTGVQLSAASFKSRSTRPAIPTTICIEPYFRFHSMRNPLMLTEHGARDARNEARKVGHTHAIARGAARTAEGKRVGYVKS